MENQQNGCIYETASPVELGAAGYRGQALLSGATGTTQRRPIRRRQFPQKP